MGNMKCIICGSTETILTDGMYECQKCGAKFTEEEANSLSLEMNGNSNDFSIDALFVEARKAAEQNELANSQKLYGQLAELCPDNWEAVLYSNYFNFANTSFSRLPENADALGTCFAQVIELAKTSLPDVDSFKTMAKEFYKKLSNTVKHLVSEVLGNYPVIADFDDCNQWVTPCLTQLLVYAEALDIYFPDGVFNLEATALRKQAIQHEVELCKALGLGDKLIRDGVYQRGFGPIEDKIRKVEPDYKRPSFLVENEVNAPANNTTNSYKPETAKSSGGCYIATAVYGSYDCPEVWTLRRYRDFTLAKTWYGRLFINTYYSISPTVVRLFGDSKWFKRTFLSPLNKMVKRLQNEGYASTPYDDRSW